MPCLTTFTSENTLPPDRNRYLVLYFNFAGIVGELHNYRKRLDAHCGTTFENFCKIYADYLPQDTVDELIEIIKPWYDNYCFTEECYGETTMYNSNMVLYFVKNYIQRGKAPRRSQVVQADGDFPRPGNEQGGEVVFLLKYGNRAPFAIYL